MQRLVMMGWLQRLRESRAAAAQARARRRAEMKLVESQLAAGSVAERRPRCRNACLRQLHEAADGVRVASGFDRDGGMGAYPVQVTGEWFTGAEQVAALRFLITNQLADIVSNRDGCSSTIRIANRGEVCIRDYGGDVDRFIVAVRDPGPVAQPQVDLYEEQRNPMSFASMLDRIGTEVTLVRTSPAGNTRTVVMASVQDRKAYLLIGTDVEEDDLIEQTLSNGKVRTYRITHVVHHEGHATGSHVEAEIEVVRAVETKQRSENQQLRVLVLTAAPHGDLRVDQEYRRVAEAILKATGRDHIELVHMPAATGSDLLDGLSRHRPHVLHFAGHANENMLGFDSGYDEQGIVSSISGETFTRALAAVDNPPRMVVLNACKSAAQLKRIVEVVSVAIGMSGSINDQAAITFSARLYSAIAEGASVSSAYRMSKVDVEIAGLTHDAELPILEASEGVDPAQLVLLPRN